MLLKTIVYDEGASSWSRNREDNVFYLYNAEKNFNRTIRYQGYIYLNQIIEKLGVEWNPDEVNLCIRNDGVDRTKFVELRKTEFDHNEFIIEIHQCD